MPGAIVISPSVGVLSNTGVLGSSTPVSCGTEVPAFACGTEVPAFACGTDVPAFC